MVFAEALVVVLIFRNVWYTVVVSICSVISTASADESWCKPFWWLPTFKSLVQNYCTWKSWCCDARAAVRRMYVRSKCRFSTDFAGNCWKFTEWHFYTGRKYFLSPIQRCQNTKTLTAVLIGWCKRPFDQDYWKLWKSTVFKGGTWDISW